jgi:hypothetical protein
MKSLAIAFSGIGVLLLIIAGVMYLAEVSYLARAERTTGTVVDLYVSISDEGGNSFCPVFEFTARGGQAVRYRGNVCTSPPSYKIGDREELLYDPGNVKSVQMDNFWSKYVGVFVLAVIGAPLALVGLYFRSAGRPK